MNAVTFSSRFTTAVVAGVAGFSSYRHIVEVAQRAGEHQAVAAVLPLSIDGLIVVGTMAMVDDKRAGRRMRSARVALGFGVVATLAANIASAQPHLTARLVAAVPAVAFLITVEVLARAGRQFVAPQLVPAVDAVPVAESFPDPWELAEPAAEPVDRVTTRKPAVRKPQPSSRERVEKAHRRTPAATHEQLAKRLDLSTKTVQRYRPAGEPVNGRVPDLEDVPV